MSDGVRVVVSGGTWMGGALGSVETAMGELLEGAQDEVLVAAYAISAAAPGWFERIEALPERGVRVRVLVNRLGGQAPAAQARLRALARRYAPLAEVASFEPAGRRSDLHAKVVVVDRRRALVGSANLSLRGLQANHELAVLVEGPAAAEIASALMLLWRSPCTFLVGGDHR